MVTESDGLEFRKNVNFYFSSQRKRTYLLHVSETQGLAEIRKQKINEHLSLIIEHVKRMCLILLSV